jgi:hypothetical protein
MRKLASWHFMPPLSNAEMVFPGLTLDESELNILWALGKNGPMTIDNLANSDYYLPYCVNCYSTENEEVWLRLGEHHTKISYKPNFIYRVVRRLCKNWLVTKTGKKISYTDEHGPREKIVVAPTLTGLILYLQSIRADDLKSAFHQSMGLNEADNEKGNTRNRKLLLFANKWDFLTKNLGVDVGEQKCYRALAQTLEDFVGIHKVSFSVKPQELKFEGYLEVPASLLMFGKPKGKFSLFRDEQVDTLLKSEELNQLLNSYIAYLIANDIRRLSLCSQAEVPECLSSLESEREFAYFKPKTAKSGSLFKGNLLKGFVPDYASLAQFFTGMFVKNLLWVSKAIVEPEVKIREKTSDYEVKEIN